MSLLTIIVALVAVGVILWVINSYIPMSASIKRLLNVVVVIILIIWLLRASGLLDSLNNIRI